MSFNQALSVYVYTKYRQSPIQFYNIKEGTDVF